MLVNYEYKLPLDERLPHLRGWVRCFFIRDPQPPLPWSWYSLSVVHLRPVQGLAPAVKHGFQTTHEYSVFACNPQADEMIKQRMPPQTDAVMLPPRFVRQAVLPSDVEAGRILEKLLEDVLARDLSLTEPTPQMHLKWSDRLSFHLAERKK